MTWLNLREDIDEAFSLLEGCGFPNNKDEQGEVFTFGFGTGFGIWDPEKEAEGKREFQREYERRPDRKAALSLWRQNNKDKINASARARAAKRRAA